jgi:hypothetical protein
MAGYVYRGTIFDADQKPKRKLKPIEHGTLRGFWAHWRRKEKPCDPCRLAKNASQNKTGRTQHPAVCGTASGYRKHRRNGEEPCLPCRLGNARDALAYYHRKKEQAS